MKVLFLANSGNWHVDLWVKYFTEVHSVYLFSDNTSYLKDQCLKDVQVIKSTGYLGILLNTVGSESHFLYQIDKFISVKLFARCVDRVIQEKKIDIVHAHSLYYGYLASFITENIPIVFTPMGSDVILHAQNNRVYKKMARKAFQKADIITGDSLLLQRQGYKVGARKENNHIIQNGVDETVFFPQANSLRQQYNVETDEVLLFSPRAITPIYNIDVIIEGISKLIKKGYKIKCMFSFAFGDEYAKQLKASVSRLGIEENVIWLGYLSYFEMAKHYNAADIVVSIPSSDSSPKSVYEAMFCKKPIIISDLEWSYELLSNSDCFLRVDARDANQLSKAISRIIEDEKLAEKLARNGLEYAHRYFSYETNMSKMNDLLVEAVNRHK